MRVVVVVVIAGTDTDDDARGIVACGCGLGRPVSFFQHSQRVTELKQKVNLYDTHKRIYIIFGPLTNM